VKSLPPFPSLRGKEIVKEMRRRRWKGRGGEKMGWERRTRKGDYVRREIVSKSKC
jgi:hypothetical protein